MMKGTLYIVATPIGNLEDLSDRAKRILSQADLIAAEDTRHSARLLTHMGINTPLTAFHEHNEHAKTPHLIEQLLAGKNIAMISDAGTPLISDPGYRLVQAAHQQEVMVSPIPGPSALISALSACGLPTHRFLFNGFLPAKSSARKNKLHTFLNEESTLIFYESPHRILACIEDMIEVFGADRMACIARELTKKFETIRTDTLGHLNTWIQADHHQQKGEFVLVIAGAQPTIAEIDAQCLKTLYILCEEMPPKKAAKIASKITGIQTKVLYQHIINPNGVEPT